MLVLSTIMGYHLWGICEINCSLQIVTPCAISIWGQIFRIKLSLFGMLSSLSMGGIAANAWGSIWEPGLSSWNRRWVRTPVEGGLSCAPPQRGCDMSHPPKSRPTPVLDSNRMGDVSSLLHPPALGFFHLGSADAEVFYDTPSCFSYK